MNEMFHGGVVVVTTGAWAGYSGSGRSSAALDPGASAPPNRASFGKGFGSE